MVLKSKLEIKPFFPFEKHDAAVQMRKALYKIRPLQKKIQNIREIQDISDHILGDHLGKKPHQHENNKFKLFQKLRLLI